ncbi:hypothetical protein MNV49_006884 [Pseudohyphozyma bogoriensis]|nr:hypothetical protein MNV49_006884 [Pseudohyphozyma bogoriensis]
MRLIALVLAATASLAAARRHGGDDSFQLPPLPTYNGSDAVDQDATDSYINFITHFSAQQQNGQAYLTHVFRALHPTQALVATSSPDFAYARFAAFPGNEATLTKVDPEHEIAIKQFLRPARRTEGFGSLAEVPVFGAYRLEWQGKVFKIYQTQWQEGFSHYDLTFVVADTAAEADLLILAVSTFATSTNEAILVFDESRWITDHELWKSVQKASWEDVILDSKLKKAVQHEYTSFFNSSELYQSLGVPWKRGVIFLGPPGNGKTISLKAMMRDAGVPSLYVKTFKMYGDDEMGIRAIFQRARQEAPCVLIMEDLDSLITDQNRSFFLNEVDGLEDNDGLLLIGTTNHFDRLDPALSNRPSRFDRKYNYPDPNKDERRQYAVYWQNKLKDKKQIEFPDTLLDEFADATKKFSFAYMKEAFVAALITLAGDESDAPPTFRTLLLSQVESLKSQIGKDEAAIPLSHT